VKRLPPSVLEGVMSVQIARAILTTAKRILSRASYIVIRDIKTKKGVEFKLYDELFLESYDKVYPYWMRLSAKDGRRLVLMPSTVHKVLKGFAKPPSMGALRRWSMDGVAKAVDGARVEPDGFSPDGAPSWLLVMGLV